MSTSGQDRNEDALKAYFAKIKTIALLDAAEEQELARRIRSGDADARRRLVEANLRLVVKIARAFSTIDVPLIDLIQEGNLGLIRAAEKFDDRRMVRFSTYASWWIKQAITRSLVNSRRAIRLPHRKEELLKRIQRTQATLSQVYAREPTLVEVAAELGVEARAVETVLGMAGSLVPLEADGDEDSGGVIDVYEDSTYSPDAELMKASIRAKTVEMLEVLLEREKKILMYRFEFFGGEKYTLKRIGAELGLSPETVRQIEKRAIRKLREEAEELATFAGA
ncbi:MAG TPA: RNA polymerase sigma factor RpoD/SigA [Spirochaetales bacterium]|nr:RNA polymerase sigma factor RpoD/SigA [Spirochaetales bacterium]